MSTKIYNAFKFNGEIEELMKIFSDIKSEYSELTKNKLKKLNPDLVFEKKKYPFLEKDIKLKDLKNDTFGEFILSDIIEKEKIISGHHPFNIDASAVVYFFENNIYVQFFGLPRNYEKTLLNKLKQFTDYHYQNSTDQSNYNWEEEKWDEMSDERQKELEQEWKERLRVWEGIYRNDLWRAPSECGLVYEFAPNHYDMGIFCKDIIDSY